MNKNTQLVISTLFHPVFINIAKERYLVIKRKKKNIIRRIEPVNTVKKYIYILKH